MTVYDPTFDSVITPYFQLVIDTYDLGVFQSCSGLGLDLDVEQYEEGGGGMFTHQLVGRFKYTNLQVTRPIGPWTTKTMVWLNAMAQYGVTGITPATAVLSALDVSGKTVCQWSLSGVIPARWTGPSFDVTNLSVATETLELAYTSIGLGPNDVSGDLFTDVGQ